MQWTANVCRQTLWISFVASLPLLLPLSEANGTPPPQYDGKVVVFGNLHAHSRLSDDVGAGDEMLPIRAFEYAERSGIDFLAISDHHKAVNSPHRLFMTASEYREQLFDVATQFNADHPGEFVAIPAIEWGNTATGNHVNLFGARTLPPETIEDADYDELFAWALDNAEFVQFNHPDGWKAKSNRHEEVGNFGDQLYDGDTEYRFFVDPVAKTISIITSVWGGHINGPYRDSEEKTHRDVKRKNYAYYKRFLNRGFHLSPAANQDTHRTNWGTVTAARTAVWADAFAYNDLMAAIRENRVYATEDDELVVAFQAEYGGKTYWMGERVPVHGEEVDVELIVRVWQAAGSDNDTTDEGPYTVRVISDWDGIGGREATVWDTVTGVRADQEHRIPVTVLQGEYIYIEVEEEGGGDNLLGDGEDDFNNSTGAFGSDDKRDDQNDQAWTSPIWFVEGEEIEFVWSRNSHLYHEPNCFAVSRIGAANRREGPAPPDRIKHDCRP